MGCGHVEHFETLMCGVEDGLSQSLGGAGQASVWRRRAVEKHEAPPDPALSALALERAAILGNAVQREQIDAKRHLEGAVSSHTGCKDRIYNAQYAERTGVVGMSELGDHLKFRG